MWKRTHCTKKTLTGPCLHEHEEAQAQEQVDESLSYGALALSSYTGRTPVIRLNLARHGLEAQVLHVVSYANIINDVGVVAEEAGFKGAPFDVAFSDEIHEVAHLKKNDLKKDEDAVELASSAAATGVTLFAAAIRAFYIGHGQDTPDHQDTHTLAQTGISADVRRGEGEGERSGGGNGGGEWSGVGAVLTISPGIKECMEAMQQL